MARQLIYSQCQLTKLSYYEEDQQQSDLKTQQQLALLNQEKIDKNAVEEEYNNFFRVVTEDVKNFELQQMSIQNFHKHQVKIMSNKSDKLWKKLIDQGNTYVQFCKSKYKGTQCFYDVVIGKFLCTVKILNLHISSLEAQNQASCLGEGSYGIVNKLRVDNRQIAIKRIAFNKPKHKKFALEGIFNPEDFTDCAQIRKAISQYCLYKICSMLKIGPQVIFQNCYDLVCYNDCIQFQMELCQQVPKKIDCQAYQRDIKRCLKILHSLKIVHKDIKKSNTLYSTTYKSYVLSDFGLTHSVKENIWQKTQTYFAGSPTYASPQMKNLLYTKQAGYVNLYMNDVYCLKTTLQQMKQEQRQFQFSIAKNQMSMKRYSYDNESASYVQQQWEPVQQIQNSEGSQINSASSLNSQSQSPSILKINQNSNTKLLNIDRLCYSHIKALYQYFKRRQQQKKQNTNILLKEIINQITKNYKCDQLLKQYIFSISRSHIEKIQNSEQSQLTNIRNSARIFGNNSKEVFLLLLDLNSKRTVSSVNYSKLQNYVTNPYKYNKITSKKFKNHLINMDRHLCLKNYRSLTTTLQTLISNYIEKKQENLQEKKEILKMGICVLRFWEINQSEHEQLAISLWKILQNKDISRKQVNKKCYLELSDLIFQELSSQNEVQLRTLSNLIHIHLKYLSNEAAENYHQKLIQLRLQLQIKLPLIPNTDFAQIYDVKRQILKNMLCQSQYFLNTGKCEKSLQISVQAYKKFTEYQLIQKQIKIAILDRAIASSTKLKKYEDAQKYTNEAGEAIAQCYFPKKNCVQFAYYYHYRGIIAFSKNDYKESIKNFQAVLQCTNDTIRGPNYVNLIKQTLQNISTCYTKLNELEKGLQYLEKALQLSLSYLKYDRYEEPIQILHHIIIQLLRLNRVDSYFVQQVNRVISLKSQLIKSERISFPQQSIPLLPAFPFQILQQFSINQQTRLIVKKIVIDSTQHHLPLFKSWYIQTCYQLCYYFINIKKAASKALPYCWKMFRNMSKAQRSEQTFRLLSTFVQLLMRINSTRRAFKYIKQYFAQIPDKYQALRIQACKRLSTISNDLCTKDKQFYLFIFKEKVFRDMESLNQAYNKIDDLPISKFAKIIWKKKLLKLKNSSTELAQKQLVLQNPQNSPQKSKQKQQIQAFIKQRLMKKKQLSIKMA